MDRTLVISWFGRVRDDKRVVVIEPLMTVKGLTFDVIVVDADMTVSNPLRRWWEEEVLPRRAPGCAVVVTKSGFVPKTEGK